MKIRKLFNVEDKIVIITGVTGQLGTQYAKAFLENGSKVIGLDINNSAKHTSNFSQYKDNYMFCNADVTDKKSLQKSLIAIKNNFGSPNVLINNAALDSPPASSSAENGPFENYPEESWDKVIDVNLKGVFLCCQVFGAEMALNNKGSIINISSIYGLVSPDQNIYDYRKKYGENFFKPVAYSASKSGIYNLSRYLAVYWGDSSVRVNTLTIAGVFNNQDEEFLNNYCKKIPIGRMADEIEYNGSVLFLASDASTYMTGSNLILDGGWTAK